MSYAPFRGAKIRSIPLRISAAQIDEDLAQLATSPGASAPIRSTTGWIRSRHPRSSASRCMQGIWLGRDRPKNRKQIADGDRAGQGVPDALRAVVVGNEVLLRGEMSAANWPPPSAREAQVPVPVTYADVWEFWLRNRDLSPRSISSPSTSCLTGRTSRSAAQCGRRTSMSIRKQVGAAFPGKEILIGETGWPSAGRMREGALPSLSAQARVCAKSSQWRSRRITASI